jgi:hypothetical protein
MYADISTCPGTGALVLTDYLISSTSGSLAVGLTYVVIVLVATNTGGVLKYTSSIPC